MAAHIRLKIDTWVILGEGSSLGVQGGVIWGHQADLKFFQEMWTDRPADQIMDVPTDRPTYTIGG